MTRSSLRCALTLLALLLLAGCKTELNTGLTEQQANEETALLLRNGIPASREIDPKSNKLTVWVEQSRFADAVDLLRANGLPRPHYDSMADVFKGNGLIDSPTEDRARMIYALSEELSHTISDIDGVLAARVQIVIPDNDPLRRDAMPASASVFVKYKPGSHVTALVPQIKMLVSGGVAGLSYDKVDVVLVPAELPPAPVAPVGMQDVFGIWVYPGSAQALRVMLAVVAAIVALLLGLGARLVWLSRHRVLGQIRRIPGHDLILR